MTKNLELDFRGNKLRGIVNVPREEGKFKTVIMFHGFGSSKMGELNQFLNLEEKLIEKNIASVRFDFLGHGESDGDFSEVTPTLEVEQGKAIVNFVKELDFVNVNNISLLGEEFGAVIASVVAGEMKDEIEELCLWNPDGELVNEVKVRKLISGVPIYKFYKAKNIDINNLSISLDFVKDLEVFSYYEKAVIFDKNVEIIEKKETTNNSIEFTKELLNCYNKEKNIAKLHKIENNEVLKKEANLAILNESLNFFQNN